MLLGWYIGYLDNIAFWSGGTLADAINGNCNVIIRKDGTAKIGSFVISKDKAQIILADGNYANNVSRWYRSHTCEMVAKQLIIVVGFLLLIAIMKKKIKLINGDVSLGYFKRKERDIHILQ